MSTWLRTNFETSRTPWKMNGWNPKSGGLEDVPFQLGDFFKFQPLIFRGATLPYSVLFSTQVMFEDAKQKCVFCTKCHDKTKPDATCRKLPSGKLT